MDALRSADGPDSPDSQDMTGRPLWLAGLERGLLTISVICILAMGALITLNILTRTFFGWSFPDSVIIVRELMMGAVVLPLAYVTAGRAHIMVEVFTSRMSPGAQLWLNILSSAVGSLTLLPIVYGGYLDLTGVWEDEAYFFGDLGLPEWPGRLAFFLGYTFFVVRLVVLTLQDVRELMIFKNKNK
ncbi:TRAP transporter small permease [Sneathiella chinensis]|uniref:TRAP transporter small permease protein n=1 Tax=Sneathiella chinensis TaxID=349750 RepID=A0ABQ5U163_9PROT|nr:TRAP transporter small permease [Sneathiella chinensis]GLQ05082.1 hypothetical protein GCM10007924_03030 [Sneathiella chinensis]